ncbi:MAG TPA: FHA domain-containing protein [Luteimonas sp.]|nr:FHA domain-containing protein [Luteimonas sp.]
MEMLKLRFADEAHSELPLAVGVHAIGPLDENGDRLGLLDDPEAARVRFCVDRRGVWLSVAEGAQGVHVNGREVHRMAMLRVGDAVYVDGVEMRLVGATPPAPPGDALHEPASDADGDPRVVLRGVGGQYHGRSFTLERPRLVGRSGDADIRIDDPAFADRHARLELLGDDVLLRDLGSAEGSLVNGEAVRDAVLRPGDQVVFDAHHRFVVEAPARGRGARERTGEELDGPAAEEDDFATEPKASPWRLPWLLLAALAIAGLLALLLLFGSG